MNTEIERSALIASLIALTGDPTEWATRCCVCGSVAITERGVSVARSTNPDGVLITGAWCSAAECQEDRRSSSAIVERLQTPSGCTCLSTAVDLACPRYFPVEILCQTCGERLDTPGTTEGGDDRE